MSQRFHWRDSLKNRPGTFKNVAKESPWVVQKELAEQMQFQPEWMAGLVREQILQDSHSVKLTENLAEALAELSKDMTLEEKQTKVTDPVTAVTDEFRGCKIIDEYVEEANRQKLEDKERIECVGIHGLNLQPAQQTVTSFPYSVRTASAIDPSKQEGDQSEVDSGSTEKRATKSGMEVVSPEKQQLRLERMVRIVRATLQEEGYEDALVEDLVVALMAFAEGIPNPENLVASEVIDAAGILLQKLDTKTSELENIRDEAKALLQRTDKPLAEIRKEVEKCLKKADESWVMSDKK
ncbi:hypothetical protein H4R24_004983 [Coemansia sp. RSA 988]|nr:hypothetical protein H4R24_004983 [Coemansia sp. RSA 988]